jgi:adenylate kinase family enzyme
VRRVVIIGPGGSGKSTLARELGPRLGLPVVHLDQMFWTPGWVQRPREEFDRLLAEALAGERWIIDGNYGRTMPVRFAACDTVLFLDFPRRIYMWRAMLRPLRYKGRTRPDMTEGCPERMTLEFLKFLWRWPGKDRATTLARLDALPPSTRVITLRSPRAVKDFLQRTRSSST